MYVVNPPQLQVLDDECTPLDMSPADTNTLAACTCMPTMRIMLAAHDKTQLSSIDALLLRPNTA
jgi:hypothetical protein